MVRIQEDGVIKCSQCDCQCAEIRGGCLVIRVRHHGQQHINVIPVCEVVQWCMDRLMLPAEMVDGVGIVG